MEGSTSRRLFVLIVYISKVDNIFGCNTHHPESKNHFRPISQIYLFREIFKSILNILPLTKKASL